MIYIVQLSPVNCSQAALSLQSSVFQNWGRVYVPQKLTILQIQKLLLKEDITAVQAFFFFIALTIRAVKLPLLQD